MTPPKLPGEVKKGAEIRTSMEKQYGKKRGRSVYFASINKGRLEDTHRAGNRWNAQAVRGRAKNGPNTFKNAFNPDGTRKKLKVSHRANISKGLQRTAARRRSRGYAGAARSI